MTNNKALIFLFNKLYNNGKFVDTVVNKNDIKDLTKFYKHNFEKFNNYMDFENEMGDIKNELNKSKSAVAEFSKQFSRRLALQPAVLSECFIVQTIANILNLDSFTDADEKEENIPKWLLEALIKAKGGELEGALPRYIYYGKEHKLVLLQYGDSSSIDAIFVKDGFRVRLEIKEENAKLGEYDLNYDENGKLIPTENILENHPSYIHFINVFNDKTNIFDYSGRNFKIGSHLTKEITNDIVGKVFDLKKIDLYILQNGNQIFAIPTKHLLDCVDVNKGSEIRTCGRNSYDVFTPKNLAKFIENINGRVNNGVITIPYIARNATVGRGKSTITRYKINNLYLVKTGDFTIDANLISFKMDKIRQNKSTISIHLHSIKNNEILKDVFDEFNKNLK